MPIRRRRSAGFSPCQRFVAHCRQTHGSSPSIFPIVGRCLSVFSFFFGTARVIGTVPITFRESAFTAVTARNGFFFLGAMVKLGFQKCPANSNANPEIIPMTITEANNFAEVFHDNVFPRINAE